MAGSQLLLLLEFVGGGRGVRVWTCEDARDEWVMVDSNVDETGSSDCTVFSGSYMKAQITVNYTCT